MQLSAPLTIASSTLERRDNTNNIMSINNLYWVLYTIMQGSLIFYQMLNLLGYLLFLSIAVIICTVYHTITTMVTAYVVLLLVLLVDWMYSIYVYAYSTFNFNWYSTTPWSGMPGPLLADAPTRHGQHPVRCIIFHRRDIFISDYMRSPPTHSPSPLPQVSNRRMDRP